jgi:hypothetical protein
MKWRSTLKLVLLFCSTAQAADYNLTALPSDKDLQERACARLLEGDYSGYYVVNSSGQGSALLELRRLGNSTAYAISTARINMNLSGKIELQRFRDGWRLEGAQEESKSVNILNLESEDGELLFRFQNPQLIDGTSHVGVSTYKQIEGDILRPDSFEMNFKNEFDATVRFTRLRLDSGFDRIASYALKSHLASRLDSDSPPKPDFVVVLEVSRPLTEEEGGRLLDLPFVSLFDLNEFQDQRDYRFAAAMTEYELLDKAAVWARQPEVRGLGVLHIRSISIELLRRVLDRRMSLSHVAHEEEIAKTEDHQQAAQ